LPIVRNCDNSRIVGKQEVTRDGFLTLWKDADPDIPILREAEAKHAKVQ
jgi:hypothetical protein